MNKRCNHGRRGGDLALSLGGRKKFSNQISKLPFWKKIEFNAEKFLLTFLVIHCTLSLSTVWNLKYHNCSPFLTKTFSFTTQNSSWRPFLVSSYFASHPITVVLEILGGWMAVSHLKFWGTVSPVSPKSPPMGVTNEVYERKMLTEVCGSD